VIKAKFAVIWEIKECARRVLGQAQAFH